MAPHPDVPLEERALSPMAIRDLGVAKTLIKRQDAYKQLASAGAQPAVNLRGPGFQVLFAIIAVAMTFTALWFFLWAKNGGFKWRGKRDWEDYKTTVMRRKGPDGKTLSNATKSTRLGGGSVVHGGSYGAESSLGFTDETATSADMTEYRDVEEGKGGMEPGPQAGLRGGDGSKPKNPRRDHTNDYKDPELRNYRHEKAARVGGLNRTADGLYTDYSGSHVASDLGSNVSSRPLVAKEGKLDAKKEAKDKERRAKERMRNAKAAEKEAAKIAAAEAKARKEAQKAEVKREKAEQKKMKKTRSEAAPSIAPEMAEVTRPLTDYQTEYNTEYTHAYTEYTAPSVAPAPSGPRRSPPSAAYSFTTGDDTNTVYTGAYTDDGRTAPHTDAAPASVGAPSEINESSYYSDYRPNADRSMYTSAKNSPDRRSRSVRPGQTQDRQLRQSQSQSQPRARPAGPRPTSHSPKKQHRTSRPTASSDIFTAANGEATGHMSYPCHIPGLSQAGSVGVSESVSQVGAPSSARRGRDVMDGFRRGGVRTVGRRDSLSDSDLD